MDRSSVPNQPMEFTGDEDTREVAFRRIRCLCLHLAEPAASSSAAMNTAAGVVTGAPCSAGTSVVSHPVVDAASLRAYMRVPRQEDRDRVLDFFRSRPDLRPPADGSQLPLEEHRELCMRQMLAMTREADVHPFEYLLTDMFRYVNVLDAAGRVDLSVTIKFGVHCSLWGSSVVSLGTQKHRDKYFEGINNLDFPGCFAMTELHHGSNVQALQTTAVFDAATDEFVIDTPNDGAIKWWIGNAASHGKFATVFARLILPSAAGAGGASSTTSDMGIHAFIVPIRDMETGAVLAGVEIRDCGPKVGLNGVDNGALRFRSVRVPRDNLLNRFGDVARDGTYTSALPTAGKRFAAMLGELVGGRVCLSYGSVSILKVATTIAVRYSLLRRQFGPAPDQPEVCILDHRTQQRRLMPMLASAYAFHFSAVHLVGMYSEIKTTSGSELAVGDLHSLAAGLKAYITSYTAKSISICRESCGGHGYAAVNVFGTLRNDHDVWQTFEGDNTVLLQQVAGELVKQYGQKFKGSGTLSLTWSYLRESMASYLSTPNHMTARCAGEDHLRDPKFQLEAFRYRTSRLLHTVAMRLRKHTKQLGSFGAWNHCLNHLMALAEAHVETIMLERFIHSVERCTDPSTRDALKLVCDLFALDRIWGDIGMFRNADYLAPNKAKAIHKLTERLCFQTRCIAQELVDAFDLPDFAIRAPIGMQDAADAYDEYTHSVGF